jgi:glycosyltransferase involved in cell wall biosynthesis
MRTAGLNPLVDGLLAARLFRLLRSFRPQAWLSWTAKPNIYGSFVAGLLGIPALPNVSGLGTAFIQGGPLQQLLSTMYRLAFARAPVVFFQNAEDMALFIDRELITRKQGWLLPGSGVDLERFQHVPTTDCGGGEFRFIFVGRLLGDKGVRELVEAARLVRCEHPSTRFQLLGSIGVENRTAIGRQEVDGWVAEGLVEHLGAVEDVGPFVAAADAVILPSYREGMPRSLLEAGAIGRPMLASDVPGNRDIVVHGHNGLLFEVRSAESIADACLRFMGLPAVERRQMGANARRTVEERFSEQQVIAEYRAALHKVLGRSPGVHEE